MGKGKDPGKRNVLQGGAIIMHRDTHVKKFLSCAELAPNSMPSRQMRIGAGVLART